MINFPILNHLSNNQNDPFLSFIPAKAKHVGVCLSGKTAGKAIGFLHERPDFYGEKLIVLLGTNDCLKGYRKGREPVRIVGLFV